MNAAITNADLGEQFLLVLRCWNDHKLAVLHGMTSEVAIARLQAIEEGATSKVLRRRAARLLHEIIYDQDEPDYLKAKVKVFKLDRRPV